MRDRVRPAARWLAAAAPLLLGGCQSALLDPRGPVGRAERLILVNSMAIMLAIVVPTIIATLAFAWWFRASNKRARYLPTWAFSGRIELVVWSIPAMVILLLGGVTWLGSYDLDPAKPLVSDRKAIDVQVVSLDWKWLFIYPDQRVASVNELVVPAGVPLHFTLTSASVMNTFFVPQLGSMIYTMNGHATELHLQADDPGTYYGRSAHFSGDGFSDMEFAVRALPAAEFDAWVASARASAGALDAARYGRLMQQGLEPRPILFSAVEPGLFDRIVGQHIPPAPGPPLEGGGAREK
ncbi:MAG TPA: ubiquinol oxidase subunit II [Caldimonas sp.]|nr:ubiquinol oxidase subunit II [Caldimonas sp.]